jgi:hypothetical protein
VEELRPLVVVAAGGDADLVARELVDKPVLVGDTARPVALEAVLEVPPPTPARLRSVSFGRLAGLAPGLKTFDRGDQSPCVLRAA